MATYTKQIATAKRLIAKKGETSTLLRTSEGIPADSDKPWRPADSAVAVSETPCSAAWLEYDESTINESTIKTGDQQVLVAASDLGTLVPDTTTDILQRASGEKWKIVRKKTLAPNGEPILYTLQVRK